MQLKQSWRWFGPNDPVTLKDVSQTGATSIVTALHHIPHGEIWSIDEIKKRKNIIEAKGLSWDVVESVNVHEAIKTQTGNYKKFIENYKKTLHHLSKCSIKIVTYNFMPVTDWTRTNLNYKMPDGSFALYFNWFDLAVFDIYILKRKNAEDNYNKIVLKEAEKRFKSYSKQQLKQLEEVILFGIPGEEKVTIKKLRKQLKTYESIDHSELHDNLKFFLKEIIPVAEEENIKLALHPDDPPFDIFGLPRIVSTKDDVENILAANKSIVNGFCFCTGSFGASKKNNLPEMIKLINDRIHFVHLRNTKRDAFGNFYEADHLNGDTDMYEVVKEILSIQQKQKEQIPFRPDHGHVMLDDLGKKTNPGYSAIGRMRGLAELRGLMLGISRNEGWD